jgi:uncharacterized OsmC-like protein
MEVKARAQGFARFVIETRGHEVVSDQPVSNGGEDSGMTPTELMAGALAGCGAYYAAQYLKTRGLSVEGLEVKVVAEKASAPARIGSFRLEIQTAPMDEKHYEPMLRSVKSCVVHNTLTHSPSVEIAYCQEGAHAAR